MVALVRVVGGRNDVHTVGLHSSIPSERTGMRLLFLAVVVYVTAVTAEDHASPSSGGRSLQHNVTVLVFGDSWGQLGPSWHAITDMFAKQGVAATVQSAAKGGTRACQWAADPDSLARAARDAFGDAGPQFVWYTAGGNDLEAKPYQDCTRQASNIDKALSCLRHATDAINRCTETLLTRLWAAFPSTEVMQCGYDIPCEAGSQCLGVMESRNFFCGHNVTCQNFGNVQWQPMLLELEHKFPGKYTGLNILGTVQQAAGVPGASVGQPVLDRGSPCGLMTYCVHPTYGQAGASAIGDAFWELYFEHQMQLR